MTWKLLLRTSFFGGHGWVSVGCSFTQLIFSQIINTASFLLYFFGVGGRIDPCPVSKEGRLVGRIGCIHQTKGRRLQHKKKCWEGKGIFLLIMPCYMYRTRYIVQWTSAVVYYLEIWKYWKKSPHYNKDIFRNFSLYTFYMCCIFAGIIKNLWFTNFQLATI